jgi:hypothetical protein
MSSILMKLSNQNTVYIRNLKLKRSLETSVMKFTPVHVYHYLIHSYRLKVAWIATGQCFFSVYCWFPPPIYLIAKIWLKYYRECFYFFKYQYIIIIKNVLTFYRGMHSGHWGLHSVWRETDDYLRDYSHQNYFTCLSV